MKEVVFFEKPGCIGNQQQKQLLTRQGVTLHVKNLLAHPWTPTELCEFFGTKPVADWFNLSAPQVKSGRIHIETIDEQQALALMLQEPLLIRRPLLQFCDLKQAGFGPGPVLDALGVLLNPEQDLQACPMEDDASVCEVLA